MRLLLPNVAGTEHFFSLQSTETALQQMPEQLQRAIEGATAAVGRMNTREVIGKTCIAIAAGALCGTVLIIGTRVAKSFLKHITTRHKYTHLPRPSGIFSTMLFPSLTLFNRTLSLDQAWECLKDPENPTQFLEAVYMGPMLDGAHTVFVCDPAMFQIALTDEKRFPKYPQLYRNLKHLLGNGLVTSTGALWHSQRKLLTPVFHFASLKLAVPTVVATTREWISAIDRDIDACVCGGAARGVCESGKEKMTDTFEESTHPISPTTTHTHTHKLVTRDTAHSETSAEETQSPVSPINPVSVSTANAVSVIEQEKPYAICMPSQFGLLTLSVIVDAVFSSSFDKTYIKRQWEHALDVSHKFFIGLGICGDIWPYLPLPIASGFVAQKEKIRACIYKLLQERKKSIAETGERAYVHGDGVSHSKDVLDEMIKVKDMPDELIVDESLTFLFAGHDTTSNLLAWTYFFVGQEKYKHIQRAIQQEVASVLGSGDSTHTHTAHTHTRDITASDIPKFKLINAVVKETLRIRPPVHSVARLTTRDEYTSNGTLIPKGTQVRLNFWAAHRDTRFWGSDAEEYNPYRWLTEKTDAHTHVSENGGGVAEASVRVNEYGDETETRTVGVGGPTHPYAYTPFSAGPRNCIGQKFALQEAVVVIAMLAQQFDITNTNTHTVRTINYGTMCPFGMQLKFEKREGV